MFSFLLERLFIYEMIENASVTLAGYYTEIY